MVPRSRTAKAGLFAAVPPWLLLAVLAATLFAFDAVADRARR